MRVVVTGGSGFIGSHVMRELRSRGIDTVSFDASTGQDVRNKTAVDVEVGRSDGVIHLAGVLGTEELFRRADHAVDVNIKGTLNVLEACKYKGARYVGITMPDVWRNVYQATKACSLRLAQAWADAFDVPIAHVCAYNAYGVGQKVKGVQKIVPTFATRAHRKQPIPIWGDGCQTVDMISASQIARVLVDTLLLDKSDVIVDAGTGEPRKVLEIAAMVADAAGSNEAHEFLPMRLGEKPTDIVAEGRGWDLIGWRPSFDFDEFLDTVAWYKEDRP